LLSHNRRMHRQRQVHASASRLRHQLPRLTRSPRTATLLPFLQQKLLLLLLRPITRQLPAHASADTRKRCRRRRLMGRARNQGARSVSQTSNAVALFRQRERRHVLHLLLPFPPH
jgi:hypothetical protein